jgi:hypothetical protein
MDDEDSIFDSLKNKVNAVVKEIGAAFESNINPGRIGETMVALENNATVLITKFNQGRENIQAMKEVLADSVHSVIELGGSMEDVLQIQESMTDVLGRNTLLMSDSFKDLYAASKASGVGADTIASSFKDVGISVYDSSKQVEMVLNTAREIGVNAKEVTNQVLDNTDMLNKYTFQGGVEGLAKMAAQATNLRINVSDMATTLDKAFDPESAIEMAAAMQRLGVTQSDLLDPLRLMDLAQNDPAELQNQIAEMSKQFVQLNEKGQFEILPGAKRQMIEIEKSLGMSQGTLSKMALASAELGDKMSKIKFPEGAFSEEQKTLIANMAEMKDGEYRITLGGEELGIDEAIDRLKGDDQKMKDLLEASKPKTLEELTKDQLGVMGALNQSVKALADRIPYAIASQKGGTDMFTKVGKGGQAIMSSFDTTSTSVKNLRGQFDQFGDGLGKLLKGESSLEEFGKSVKKLGDFMNDTFIEVAKNVDKNVEGATGLKIYETVQKIDNTLSNAKDANDFIISEEGVLKTAPQDTIIGMTQGDKLMGMLEKMQTINPVTPAQPLEIKTSVEPVEMTNPMDTVQNFIKNMPPVVTTNENNNTNKNEMTMNLNVSGLPSGANTEEVIKVIKETLGKTEFMREFNKMNKDTQTNDNMTVS